VEVKKNEYLENAAFAICKFSKVLNIVKEEGIT